MMVFPGIGF